MKIGSGSVKSVGRSGDSVGASDCLIHASISCDSLSTEGAKGEKERCGERERISSELLISTLIFFNWQEDMISMSVIKLKRERSISLTFSCLLQCKISDPAVLICSAAEST